MPLITPTLLPLLLALSTLSVAVPHSPLISRADTSCSDIHILVARASTEAAGDGVIGSVAAAVISSSSKTVTQEAIDYPALLSPYDTSSQAGTAAVKKQFAAYAASCPDAKIVLMGYSQGAHIIGDAMCGGGGLLIGAKTEPMASSLTSKVVAVLQMGDPRHTKDETYHVGTSTGSGLFPRTSDQSCESYASVFRSYCDSGDTFCDSGLNTLAHLMYVTVYGTAAARWVVEKIGG